MRRRMQRYAAGAVLILGATGWLGCVESTWEATRRLDTVAAYNQFIRDHPESRHLGDARERMSFLRVTTYRTIESFEEFRTEYPNSSLMPELLVTVEPLFFDRARQRNTADAYREFLAAYPNGQLTAKARGNLVYVSEVLPNPTAPALERFIADHPVSDFHDEARRTLSIMSSQRGTAIRRLGVRVDVAPNVTQGARVSQGFGAMIARAYRERGIEVVVLGAEEVPGPELDAWVRVDYKEAPAASTIGASSLFSFCRVRLFHRDFEEPVWDRSFEAPADHIEKGAYGRDKTVFGNSKYRFWSDFFVPVATWAVSSTRVKQLNYPEQVRAIHVLGDSAALLLERGGVDFLDVSSPSELKVADRYRREVDLADWRGVRMLRSDLAITFGNDGAELIHRSNQSVSRLARWDAGELGAVRSAALFDDATLLIAGSRGVHAVRMNKAPLMPQKLLDGEVVGLEVHGGLVYVVRQDRLEIALPKHLLQHITARRLPLEPGFRAERVRRVGSSLFVFGRDAVAEFAISDPAKPELLATVEHGQFGAITDVVADRQHRYILGERGLQVTDPGSKVPSDYIQVAADDAVTLKGRFAILVGQNTVEVLDLAPYFQDGDFAEPRQESLPAKSSFDEAESGR